MAPTFRRIMPPGLERADTGPPALIQSKSTPKVETIGLGISNVNCPVRFVLVDEAPANSPASVTFADLPIGSTEAEDEARRIFQRHKDAESGTVPITLVRTLLAELALDVGMRRASLLMGLYDKHRSVKKALDLYEFLALSAEVAHYQRGHLPIPPPPPPSPDPEPTLPPSRRRSAIGRVFQRARGLLVAPVDTADEVLRTRRQLTERQQAPENLEPVVQYVARAEAVAAPTSVVDVTFDRVMRHAASTGALATLEPPPAKSGWKGLRRHVRQSETPTSPRRVRVTREGYGTVGMALVRQAKSIVSSPGRASPRTTASRFIDATKTSAPLASSRSSEWPPLPSDLLRSSETIWRLLERSHGSPGKRGIPEVRLLRLSWLLGPALASKADGNVMLRSERLPPRHVLEASHPEAFLSEEELRQLTSQLPRGVDLLPIVAVAHDWATPMHPDPTAERLVAIATALAELQRGQGGATTSLGAEEAVLPEEVGLYIPWCSLCQADPKGCRTVLERKAYVGALETLPIWYTHAQTTVLLVQPAAPPPHALPPAWHAPFAAWGVGGGMPSVERSALLLLGKRRYGNATRWAQLVEARLGEDASEDLYATRPVIATCFASASRGRAAVEDGHLSGQPTAKVLSVGQDATVAAIEGADEGRYVATASKFLAHSGGGQATESNAGVAASSVAATTVVVSSVAAGSVKPLPSQPLPMPIPIKPLHLFALSNSQAPAASPVEHLAADQRPRQDQHRAHSSDREDDALTVAAASRAVLIRCFDGVKELSLDGVASLSSLRGKGWHGTVADVGASAKSPPAAGAFTGADLSALATMLPFVTRSPTTSYTLESLSLASNGLSDEGIEDLCVSALGSGVLQNLRHLSLADNQIRGTRCPALGPCLASPVALQGLHELSFSLNRLGDDGMRILMSKLPLGSLASLRILRLDSNRLGDDGLKALARAFGRGAMEYVDTLDLAGNRITDLGLAALVRLACERGGALQSLTALDVSGNRIGPAKRGGGAAVGSASDETDADLGVATLAAALAAGHLCALRLLNLSGNRLSDRAARALAAAGRRGGAANLHELRLEDNMLSRFGVQSLATTVADGQSWPFLATLSLRGNVHAPDADAIAHKALVSAVGSGPRALLSLGSSLIDGRGKPPEPRWMYESMRRLYATASGGGTGLQSSRTIE